MVIPRLSKINNYLTLIYSFREMSDIYFHNPEISGLCKFGIKRKNIGFSIDATIWIKKSLVVITLKFFGFRSINYV